MNLRERLSSLLLAEGIDAKPHQLWPAQGHWRTDVRADVYRWEGQGTKDGHVVLLCCWDTMTKCVRNGITVTHERGWSYEIHAKEKP